ncbi:hypothetical protein [Candidatus Nitrosotenuis cloacae]|jgi:hypothetical protein|uniref:hypothetical protein n=1 Tax=Candidatus Nitrosotenuis cloacae TaxID=1603555 RepID=UPI00227E1B16|nr:hypothetical protein [Candidatus Nitrosotenuis cloacae]
MAWQKTAHFGLFGIAALFLVSFYNIDAFAQAYNSTTITGDEIKKNPTASQILKNIELSKKILAELQSGKKIQTEHEKFVEEQRALAKAELEKDLSSFNKKYIEYTPKNAFSSFVNRVNATYAPIYWDQFNFMNEKIRIATQAKETILNNGGTYLEAQKEYIKYASLPRTEMIRFVTDLNIKYGFTDEGLQSYFDDNGKLPRYEEDRTAICYSCDKYEKIKQVMLEEHERAKNT